MINSVFLSFFSFIRFFNNTLIGLVPPLCTGSIANIRMYIAHYIYIPYDIYKSPQSGSLYFPQETRPKSLRNPKLERESKKLLNNISNLHSNNLMVGDRQVYINIQKETNQVDLFHFDWFSSECRCICTESLKHTNFQKLY